MKLIDVAASIKSAHSERLENISIVQIQRILAQGLREVRAAVESAGDEAVVVPGLGRFRSRDIELKNAPEGEEAGSRRIIKFVPARDRQASEDESQDGVPMNEDANKQEHARAL